MIISIYTLPEEGKTWAECKTGDITDCISFEYERYFNGVGTFTLEIPINSRFCGGIGVNSVLVTADGDALMVKNIRTTVDKVKITGYDLNCLLYDRVTLGGEDSVDGADPYSGTTEECVKHYVAANLCASPVAERNLPRFAVAPDLGRGRADDRALPRLQNVGELVTELCGAAGLGWRVSVDSVGASGKTTPVFVFDVAEQVDRSAGQDENPRVIFSEGLHNISEMTREVGVTASRNAIYCDIDGTVVQYPAAGQTEGRTAGAGYSRREEYCALSGGSLDPAVYGAEAEQNMAGMEETDSLTIDAGSPLDYRVRYDAGDIVTAYDAGRSLQLDSVISAAKIRRTATEYSVKLTLGESKPKLLDGYAKKNEATTRTVRVEKGKSDYISLPVRNSAAVSYGAAECGLLSVDFTVNGTDSAVVFAGSQQCGVTAAGTVDVTYSVDGAEQDFAPSHRLPAGRSILPHYAAFSLPVGRHNLTVRLSSADGGRGNVAPRGFAGAVSGQISDLTAQESPNDNLLLYLRGLPAGAVVALPKMYNSGGAKTVDWGDGTTAEQSASDAAVSHTYAQGGEAVITVQSDVVQMYAGGAYTQNTWKDCLTAVYFPDGAVAVSFGAMLSECPQLEAVYFGKSATTVSAVLKNDVNLRAVTFPDTAQTISVNLANTAVTEIIVPAAAAKAGDFSGMVSLRSITFKGAVFSCRGDSNLRTVSISDSVTEIPDLYFNNCPHLVEITLPQAITRIGANAFSRSTALRRLPLLRNLTEIGVRAFDGCTALSDVKLGGALATIGIYAFAGCGLRAITLPAGVRAVPEGAFSGCTALAAATVGDVLTIGEKAFEGCAALTSFNFPAGVVIGANAFAKTGFTSVDALGFMPQLSEGTTAHGGRYNIGQGAFANCSALAKVSGYEYRWSVGLKMTEARRDESGVWTTEVTDLGEMVEGICSFMGATLDSVFAGTALKTERDFLADHPEYTDVSTADYTCTYTAYRIV